MGVHSHPAADAGVMGGSGKLRPPQEELKHFDADQNKLPAGIGGEVGNRFMKQFGILLLCETVEGVLDMVLGFKAYGRLFPEQKRQFGLDVELVTTAPPAEPAYAAHGDEFYRTVISVADNRHNLFKRAMRRRVTVLKVYSFSGVLLLLSRSLTLLRYSLAWRFTHSLQAAFNSSLVYLFLWNSLLGFFTLHLEQIL